MGAKENRFHDHLARTLIVLVGSLLVYMGLGATDVWAQKGSKDSGSDKKTDQYVIAATDKLSITFWQQPDLNRDVRVGEDGNITIPVVGEIRAAGLTTSQLAKKIIQQMSFYNASVSQATVTVLEFNSNSVVVSGQVVKPGSLSYEKIPDVWKVILDAGGPTQLADLSRVTIVRKQGDKSQVIPVDINKIIRDGDLSQAPTLMPGDLVSVPISSLAGASLGGAGAASAGGGLQQFEAKNVYYVIGAVTEQGPKSYEEGLDVLDAINVAKGITPEADLKNVRVIMKDAKYSNVIRLNLQKYINTGSPARVIIHPEDTIVVPVRRSGTFTKILNVLAVIAPVAGAVGTAILLTRKK